MARKAYNGYTEKSYYENTKYYGIVATTDPLAEGYFRDIINFDISDTGASLKPRTGFLTTSVYSAKAILSPNIDLTYNDPTITDTDVNKYYDMSDGIKKTIEEITTPCIKLTGSNIYESTVDLSKSDIHRNSIITEGLPVSGTVYGQVAENQPTTDVLAIPKLLCMNTLKTSDNINGEMSIKLFNPTLVFDINSNVDITKPIVLCRYERLNMPYETHPLDNLFGNDVEYDCYFNDIVPGKVRYKTLNHTEHNQSSADALIDKIAYRVFEISDIPQEGTIVSSIRIKLFGEYNIPLTSTIYIDHEQFTKNATSTSTEYTYNYYSLAKGSGDFSAYVYNLNDLPNSIINNYPDTDEKVNSLRLKNMVWNTLSYKYNNQISQYGKSGNRYQLHHIGYVKDDPVDPYNDFNDMFGEQLYTDISDLYVINNTKYEINYNNLMIDTAIKDDTDLSDDQFGLSIMKDVNASYTISDTIQLKKLLCGTAFLSITPIYRIKYTTLSEEYLLPEPVEIEKVDRDTLKVTLSNMHVLHSKNNEVIYVNNGNLNGNNLFYVNDNNTLEKVSNSNINLYSNHQQYRYHIKCDTIECQCLDSLKGVVSNSIIIRAANILPNMIAAISDIYGLNKIVFNDGISVIKNIINKDVLTNNNISVYLPSTVTEIFSDTFDSTGYQYKFFVYFSNNTKLESMGDYALRNSYCNKAIIDALSTIELLGEGALYNIFESSNIDRLIFSNESLDLWESSLYGFIGTVISYGANITDSDLEYAGLSRTNYTLETYYKINITISNSNNTPENIYISDYKDNNHSPFSKTLYIDSNTDSNFTLCTIDCDIPGLKLTSITSDIDIGISHSDNNFPVTISCNASKITDNISITLTPETDIDNEIAHTKIFFDDKIFFTFTYNHWNIFVSHYKISDRLRGVISYDLSSKSVISENADNFLNTHNETEDYCEHFINVDKVVANVYCDELFNYIYSIYNEYLGKPIYNYLYIDNHIASSIIDENGVQYGLLHIRLLSLDRQTTKHNLLVKVLYNVDDNCVHILPYNTQTNYSIYDKNLASHNSLIPTNNMQQVYKYEDIKDTENSGLYTQVNAIYAHNKITDDYYIQFYNCPITDIELIPSYSVVDYSNENLNINSFEEVLGEDDMYSIQVKEPNIRTGLETVYCYEIYSTESLLSGLNSVASINSNSVYRSPIFLLDTNENISKYLNSCTYYVYNESGEDEILNNYTKYNVYTGLKVGEGNGLIADYTINDSSLFTIEQDDSGNKLLKFDISNFDSFSSSSTTLKRYLHNGIIIIFHIMQVPYNAFKNSYGLSIPNNYDTKFKHTNPYATLLSYSAMVSTSGSTTQSLTLMSTSDKSIVTTINQADKTLSDQVNIDLFDGYCVFNSTEGDRMTVWKNVHLYITVAANAYNTEGFFPSSLHFTFDEPIVKVLPYRNILIVFTTMNVYTIYPYTDTQLVNVQEQDDEGNITVKQQSQEYIAYAKMCVLYNILCDKKYADAIQIFNQMILFYSSDGQMYLIKPSATIDSDTRFSIQYFNKNVNDILTNYHEYIQERLSVYNIDLVQRGYLNPTVTKDMVNIKVLASINYIKIFYSVPNIITYILVYDVVNNRWLAYDTVSFTNVTDVTFIESGDLYLTKTGQHLYLTVPYKDLYIPNNNCDMSITNDFQKEPINTEIDTGNLDLNNHLKKRFRSIKTVYKNLDATNLKFKTEVILDDVLIDTFADRNIEVRNINGMNTYQYDYIENQPDVELLDNQTVLFDISSFTSNKILTHTRSIVSVGKVIRFKLQFSSSGCYKVNSYGIIYKERTV